MKTKVFVLSVLALCFLAFAGCEDDNPSERKGQSDALFNPSLEYGSLTDIDGNVYKTIKIGEQTWMAQNLRVTHYRNGDAIAFDADSTSDWRKVKIGTYCAPYSTTNADTIATYGLLYNGYAVQDTRKIAPEGWRIPGKEDVEELYTYLESQITKDSPMRPGGRLKEAGTKHWSSPNIADNSTGFTLLPTPMRDALGYNPVLRKKTAELFTISSRYEATDYLQLFVYGATYDTDVKTLGHLYPDLGLAVRCIKED